jgi:hypothetical protein
MAFLGLVVLFVSVFGVQAPEIGDDCTEALAKLEHAGLHVQSVELTEGGVTHTLVYPGRHEKVAVVVCGANAVDRF